MRALRSQLTPVFVVGVGLSLVFVLWAALSPQGFTAAGTSAQSFTVERFGWLYLAATTFFVGFVIFLAASRRYGHLKLGRDDEKPEFSRVSWFAMLFQAGMGIGLVFWAASEPLAHFAAPPYGLAPPNTPAAGDISLRYTFFHWALHPWAIYAVVALAIGYFNFRLGRSGLLSEVFRPLLGSRVDGPLGRAIDVLAILATLFGVAVSLGLGALQIASGLNYLFLIPNTVPVQIAIIAITTVAFIASAATGINRGIKWLSNASLVLAGLLLLFVLVTGPTVVQLDAFTQGLGSYVGDIIPMSFRLNAFAEETFPAEWTLFFWGTWIAWAPYVGSFIARISRGRTIREFVIAVLLVPSVIGIGWLAIFGAGAIELDKGLGGELSRVASSDEARGLFTFLDQLPLALVASLLAIGLVFVFFVAGADAGTIVLGRFSTKGILNPGRPVRIVWGIIMGAVAAVVIAAGGLDGLQSVSILAALPFVVLLLTMCWALLRALREDEAVRDAAAVKTREPAGAPPVAAEER
ncbi:MAG TPA: BCCT family transporter [Solirubrobacteraceae bacterium]|nr:BCCT family transporter [Solirubrobacteraceae bacterium]